MTLPSRSHGLEVADILRTFGAEYQSRHRLPLQQQKVIKAIVNCRTAALGGHLDKCDTCDYEQPAYNSCRNRHCPKCGWAAKQAWVRARMRELLPVTYFHVVFTIPHELNALALENQEVIYGMLFRAAAETLLVLGHDAKHLGGQLGFLAMLHTWGQNLMNHLHVHCLVPGGGLSDDGQAWLSPKKMNTNKAFFIHVQVLSALFKKKFLAYLKEAYQCGKLKFIGAIAALGEQRNFQALLNTLYGKGWNVYCKAPFSGPEKVLEYLARYTHRVAISNHRLLKLEQDRITFKWRDYRDGKVKQMTLHADEFIRRFQLHVLPRNFYRIRYYGILSSRQRKTKLARCRELLKAEQVQLSEEPSSSGNEAAEILPDEARRCPKCQKGHLIRQEIPRLSPARMGMSDAGPP